MNELLEKMNKTSDERIEQNLIMYISEQKIIELISEDEIYVYTMTSACPTSFLICC